jgi:hypothetical protein
MGCYLQVRFSDRDRARSTDCGRATAHPEVVAGTPDGKLIPVPFFGVLIKFCGFIHPLFGEQARIVLSQ